MTQATSPLSQVPSKAEVVVIGGGIIGVSTLYHLAKKGVGSAVLLERKTIASGTTWHAAGIVGQLRESSGQTELSRYTARLFTELEVETGQATGYKQNGTLHVALSDLRMEQLRRNHDHAGRMGIESHLLDPDQVSERYSHLRMDDVLGGFFVPSNGQVNPLDVTQAMAKGARARGAQVLEHTAATRIVTRNGRVCGVETDRGVIATEKVLLAGRHVDLALRRRAWGDGAAARDGTFLHRDRTACWSVAPCARPDRGRGTDLQQGRRGQASDRRVRGQGQGLGA
jgi:glycine/D-amino acid oxidase-like deaminating enzyme